MRALASAPQVVRQRVFTRVNPAMARTHNAANTQNPARYEPVKRSDAADAVRPGASHGPEQGPGKRSQGREVSALHRRQTKFTSEVEHIRTCQPDKTTKGDGVVKAKPMGVFILQKVQVILEL